MTHAFANGSILGPNCSTETWFPGPFQMNVTNPCHSHAGLQRSHMCQRTLRIQTHAIYTIFFVFTRHSVCMCWHRRAVSLTEGLGSIEGPQQADRSSFSQVEESRYKSKQLDIIPCSPEPRWRILLSSATDWSHIQNLFTFQMNLSLQAKLICSDLHETLKLFLRLKENVHGYMVFMEFLWGACSTVGGWRLWIVVCEAVCGACTVFQLTSHLLCAICVVRNVFLFF